MQPARVSVAVKGTRGCGGPGKALLPHQAGLPRRQGSQGVPETHTGTDTQARTHSHRSHAHGMNASPAVCPGTPSPGGTDTFGCELPGAPARGRGIGGFS